MARLCAFDGPLGRSPGCWGKYDYAAWRNFVLSILWLAVSYPWS